LKLFLGALSFSPFSISKAAFLPLAFNSAAKNGEIAEGSGTYPARGRMLVIRRHKEAVELGFTKEGENVIFKTLWVL